MPDIQKVTNQLEADLKRAYRTGDIFVYVGTITARNAVELLKAQPQVVRCKDCIYWDKGHTEQCENSDSVCFHNGWCKPDWFCADGERKDGEQE